MLKRILLTIAAMLLLAADSRAALIYRVSTDPTNTVLNTGLDVNIGSPLTFNVFLHETFIDGVDTPRIGLNPGENGLTTANFGINRTAGTTVSITGASGNALFDLGGGPTVIFAPASATVAQETLVNDPVVAPSSATGRRTIQLGSVTVSGLSLGSSTFQLADFGLGDDLVIGDGISPGFVADGIVAFGSITITAVPEPSSLALVGLIGAAGLLHRRRRRIN